MKTIEIEDSSDIPKNFTGIVEHPSGDKHWYLNGKHHREVGPCTSCKDCLNGNFVLCTKPGPAVEFSNGDKIWFLNGKHHRIDGPAISCSNGREYWYLHGELHREDGPAVEFTGGSKLWILNGKKTTKEIVELLYMLKRKKIFEP